MLVAHQDILLVIFIVAAGVRLLDTAPRRRVVAGYGEANHGVVAKLDGLLNQSLAKRATTDDGASVVVLNGTSQNLRGRGRPLVDEDDERYGGIGATSVAAILLARRLTSLGVDDKAVLGQKLVGYLHSRLQVTAGIAAQVDGEVAQTLLRQLGECDEQLWVCILAEVLDADIARIIVQHIGSRDALGGYLATRHHNLTYLLLAVAHHAQLHLRVLRTLQAVHGFLVGQRLTRKGLVVNGDNLVASYQTRPLSRSVAYHLLHMECVLTDGKLNAHPRERALQVVIGYLHVLG